MVVYFIGNVTLGWFRFIIQKKVEKEEVRITERIMIVFYCHNTMKPSASWQDL